MLVLSRKLNETIVIDGDIRITVVGIRGNQVRIGIEAPDSVAIFREELCNRAGAFHEHTGNASARAACGDVAVCSAE
jgi:carbon storage regulator